VNSYEPSHFADFYKSLCGRLTSKIINQQIISLWPECHNMRVLMIGWPFPYISHFQKTATHVSVAIPHSDEDKKKTIQNYLDPSCVCVDINNLPFEERSFDRIIMVHGCEYAYDLPQIFHDIERLLTDDGRLIAIVPNLSGIWRKNKSTPFSAGSAVTSNQLRWAMQHGGFAVEYFGHALSFPPTQNKRFLSLAAKWEGKGQYFTAFLCGTHIFEAHKNLFSGTVVKPATKLEIMEHQQLSGATK